MVKEIIVYPNQILLNKSVDISLDSQAKEVCEALEDTLMTKPNGVGLAAPQIGLNYNVFLMNVQGFKEFCINPKVVNISDSGFMMTEGCLSLPGKSYKVPRSAIVSVEYYDRNFILRKTSFGSVDPFEDFRGIVFQHEFDHLFGQLINNKFRKNPIQIQTK